MKNTEQASQLNYPIGKPDTVFGIHNDMISAHEQNAFENGAKWGIVEFAEWLSHPECEVVLVDGNYYYRTDEDGDMELTSQQVFEIFNTTPHESK